MSLLQLRPDQRNEKGDGTKPQESLTPLENASTIANSRTAS
jgi:hypothetical protein